MSRLRFAQTSYIYAEILLLMNVLFFVFFFTQAQAWFLFTDPGSIETSGTTSFTLKTFSTFLRIEFNARSPALISEPTSDSSDLTILTSSRSPMASPTLWLLHAILSFPLSWLENWQIASTFHLSALRGFHTFSCTSVVCLFLSSLVIWTMPPLTLLSAYPSQVSSLIRII